MQNAVICMLSESKQKGDILTAGKKLIKNESECLKTILQYLCNSSVTWDFVGIFLKLKHLDKWWDLWDQSPVKCNDPDATNNYASNSSCQELLIIVLNWRQQWQWGSAPSHTELRGQTQIRRAVKQNHPKIRYAFLHFQGTAEVGRTALVWKLKKRKHS